MELLRENIPTSLSSIYTWAYNDAQVVRDKDSGTYYYNIKSKGYLEQGVFELVVAEKALHFAIYFATDAPGVVVGQATLIIYFDDDSFDSAIIPLVFVNPDKQNYVKIEHTYTTPKEKRIQRTIVRVQNKHTADLRVSSVSLTYDKDEAELEQYDLKKFQDNVILYGLDANKPKLR